MAKEKRLIDANDLIERLKFKKKISEVGLHRGLQSAMSQCDKAPTVDAVEVVRCKDCKYLWEISAVDRMFYCRNKHGLSGINIVEENPFCSYGERRSE